MSTATSYGYHVEQVDIDITASCIRRGEVDHVLRYQTFQVLVYLLEHTGRVVPKEELIAEIWRDAAVTDNALTQCITEIRKALGDNRHNPIYIRTVSKVGYQFVAPVEMVRVNHPHVHSETINGSGETAPPTGPPNRFSGGDQRKPSGGTFRAGLRIRTQAPGVGWIGGRCAADLLGSGKSVFAVGSGGLGCGSAHGQTQSGGDVLQQ